MADLSSIDQIVSAAEQSVTGVIYQPNGDPYLAPDGTECTISVQGKESKAYRRARDMILRRGLRSRKANIEPHEVRQNRVDQAAAVFTGWHGWTEGERILECAPEYVKRWLAHDHLLEQAEALIEGHASFFSKNSAS